MQVLEISDGTWLPQFRIERGLTKDYFLARRILSAPAPIYLPDDVKLRDMWTKADHPRHAEFKDKILSTLNEYTPAWTLAFPIYLGSS